MSESTSELRAGGSPAPSALREYLNVLRRRWRAALFTFLIALVAAAAYSAFEDKTFSASAEVLLSRQDLSAQLTDAADPLAGQDAERAAQTQVSLARVATVAERAIAAAEKDSGGYSAGTLLNHSAVTALTNADLLMFTVEHPRPDAAVALANAYANAYTEYRLELDTKSLARARDEVSRRLRELQAEAVRPSRLIASLAAKEQELRTLEALRTANATVVQSATRAQQVSPHWRRNLMAAALLGLLAAMAMAFAREALDTRVRSAQQVEQLMDLPLLAPIPTPARRYGRRLVMLDGPGDVAAEPFRLLRANLQFSRVARPIDSLMVTSAIAQEGKSTTLGNLAIALARGGDDVVLVDLDLRRPALDALFPIEGVTPPGFGEVVLGEATLRDALAEIDVSDQGAQEAKPSDGRLRVLRAGQLPPAPGEFVGQPRLAELLDDVRADCSLMLIDAPPLLPFGDALSLSKHVEAVLLVARANVVRRQMLVDVRRLLGSMPTRAVGFVLTAADTSEEYGAGYGRGYGYGYGTVERSGTNGAMQSEYGPARRRMFPSRR